MFKKSWLLVVGVVLSLSSIAMAQEKKAAPASVNAFPDCTVVAGNLVQNCGFETGDFTGWIQGGDTSYTSVDTCGHSGNYCVHTGPTGYNGTLTQSLSTTGTCMLSFWVNNAGQASRFSVEWNAKTVFIHDYVPDFSNYEQFTLNGLPGGSGTSFLTFTFYNQPSYINLDDVVVLCQ